MIILIFLSIYIIKNVMYNIKKSVLKVKNWKIQVS